MSEAEVSHKVRRHWVPDCAVDLYVKHIGLAAHGLYTILCRHANRDGEIVMSVSKLAKTTGITRNTIKSTVAKLRAWGLIKWEPVRRENGVIVGYVYFLAEVPPVPVYDASLADYEAFPWSEIDHGGGQILTRGVVKISPGVWSEIDQGSTLYKGINSELKEEGAARGSTPKLNAEQMARFERFWEPWPNKKSRKDAEKAWLQLEKETGGVTEQLEQGIIQAINIQLGWDGWIEEGGKFIPLPATWIRGAKWNDQPTTALTLVGGEATQKPFNHNKRGDWDEQKEQMRRMLGK